MAKIFFFFLTGIVLFFTFSCQSQANKEAKELANKIESTVVASAGMVIASPAGNFLNAKINGKEWNATSVFTYETVVEASRIYGEKGEDFIGFPFNEQWDRVGKKAIFGDSKAADLSYSFGENNTWGGRKGEMEITKADDKVIEGKFFFTATSERSDKVVEVTDGSFRILRNLKK